MEVREAIGRYILDCRACGLSRHTVRVYEQRLRHFLRFLQESGVRETEEMEADHLRGLIVQLREGDADEFTNHRRQGKRRTGRTLFHYARIIKGMGNWLEEQEILPRNPFARVKMPRVEQRMMPAMVEEDMVALYYAIARAGDERATRDLAIFCLMTESGMRRSEVVSLTLDNLYVHRFTAKVHGKGSKERLVYFTDQTAKPVTAYLEERPRVEAREVFLNLRTRRPLTADGLTVILQKRGERAGIRCRPHLLRHTFATRYLMNGHETNLISLQKLLGHSSLDMVRRYVDMLPVDVETEYRKFSPLSGLDLMVT